MTDFKQYSYFFMLATVFLLLMVLHSFYRAEKNIEVKKNGRHVYVKLTSIPSNYGSTADFKFIYRGKEYQMTTRPVMKRYLEGDTMLLVNDENHEDTFLFPDDNPEDGWIHVWVFSIFSVIFLIATVLCWNSK